MRVAPILILLLACLFVVPAAAQEPRLGPILGSIEERLRPRLAAAEAAGSPAGGRAIAMEPGPLALEIQAPNARRAWLYYQPDAGETLAHYFAGPQARFEHAWQVEAGTGGLLFVAAEHAGGAIVYSEPLRAASNAYNTLQKAVSPDARIRLEVNLPAFQLGLYRGNQLLKTFRIGIGLKSWPAPPGLRVAHEIVWW